MNYLLAVLTHGDPYATMPDAIGSLVQHVTPQPTDVIVWFDGDYQATSFKAYDMFRYSPLPITHDGTEEQLGFCKATAALWEAAALSRSADYVFWLEHDFEFTRHVDLAALAAVLDAEPRLAQMALMRDAVNETEKAAGGLFESRPGQYEPRRMDIYDNSGPWLEHAAYFTTNPSLMRRQFMAENPWPDPAIVSEQCEGRFGIDLIAAGYSFGVWGAGEPWVEHVGVRDGFGY